MNGDPFEQLDRRCYYGTSGSWSWSGAFKGPAAPTQLGCEARQDRIEPIGLYRTAARGRLSTTREDDVVETSGGLYGQLGQPVKSPGPPDDFHPAERRSVRGTVSVEFQWRLQVNAAEVAAAGKSSGSDGSVRNHA